MKKAILVFIIVAAVLFTTGLWIFSANGVLGQSDLITIGIIFLLVLFAVFVGYKRLTSARRGEPVEDELTKNVLRRTAALSYYISLYLWVAILFIKDRITIDPEEMLGAGILGMAITFAICWIIFNFRGVRND